ncbi:hypothetical protein [Lactobacillus sp. ESL0681]|uniref:hypothetical protein n=1 Tax=Lactobacillus sp. ESL0681 TaxID=2983211 RepID=UPI0023F675C9|nr:hypothetical protein [Lactobacillus sp. ESL0681]WEV39926.1 hypothetical protein OZX59_06860 [Lactobacillus sp. ESL0681]
MKLNDFSMYSKKNTSKKVSDYFIPINIKKFRKLIANKKTFVAYIGRPTCEDCRSFEKQLLKKDLNPFKGKVVYLNVTKVSKNLKYWNKFKKSNFIYGTPAFVSYKEGRIYSSSSWSVENGYNSNKAINWLNKQKLQKVY